MNRHEARRFLIAARDNPVVAAWASVLHEHKAAVPTDVSPYEAWEAFQGLHDAGVVTTQEFDAMQGSFFERIPAKDELELALINLRILPDADALEDIMFKKTSDSKSLETVAPPNKHGALSTPVRAPLSPPIRTPLSQPTQSPPPGVPGRPAGGLKFGAPPGPASLQGSSLPCVENGLGELKPELPCPWLGCNGKVTPVDLGPLGIAEAEIASLSHRGEVKIYNVVYGTQCSLCNKINVTLGGEMPSP